MPYYDQVTSYDITDLYLQSPEDIEGPFPTPEERDKAFIENMEERDLETSETVAVSFLKVEDNQLQCERTFIANWEDGPIPKEDN